MISALPKSELSRDAVRDRSWRICEKKHLLAPTQSNLAGAGSFLSQALKEWAEKKDTVCDTRSTKLWASFCYVLSLAEVVGSSATAVRIKFTSVLDNCCSICVSSVSDGHPYLTWQLINYQFSLFLLHELLLSLDPHSNVFCSTHALYKPN